MVDSDGYWLVLVKIPATYDNKVQGLCGNYDGNMANDLTTSYGEDVSGDEDKYNKVGNSWFVVDDTDPG